MRPGRGNPKHYSTRQLSGRTSWREAIPRPHALLGGIVVWLAATWAHGALGYMVAGIWRWIG